MKPNNFPLRPKLNGTEEFYTQTDGISEKFLLEDVNNYIITNTLNVNDKLETYFTETGESKILYISFGDLKTFKTTSNRAVILGAIPCNSNVVFVEACIRGFDASKTLGYCIKMLAAYRREDGVYGLIGEINKLFEVTDFQRLSEISATLTPSQEFGINIVVQGLAETIINWVADVKITI
jgi:hypothetical protein